MLTRGLSQLRGSLLQAVRFHVSVDTVNATGAWSGVLTRGFASTYLNKDDVTERIVTIVKNFDNVDQGKVHWWVLRGVEGCVMVSIWDGVRCSGGKGATAVHHLCSTTQAMQHRPTQHVCNVNHHAHTPPMCFHCAPHLSQSPPLINIQVTPTSEFQKDLGLDSLDTVELVMALEEEFAIEIPDSEADKILSCADAINYIASHPMAK